MLWKQRGFCNIFATKIRKMNWEIFKQHLVENKNLRLQFEYEDGIWVDNSYHLTEIKQAQIVSVDCGGKMNTWNEVVLQLWEPENKEESQAMTVPKALSIIEQVEKSIDLHPKAIVKIEYGNDNFPTRQMLLEQFELSNDHLIVKLHADKTQCKAIDRGETCGTPKKRKVTLAGLPIADQNCDPGSGCC